MLYAQRNRRYVSATTEGALRTTLRPTRPRIEAVSVRSQATEDGEEDTTYDSEELRSLDNSGNIDEHERAY